MKIAMASVLSYPSCSRHIMESHCSPTDKKMIYMQNCSIALTRRIAHTISLQIERLFRKSQPTLIMNQSQRFLQHPLRLLQGLRIGESASFTEISLQRAATRRLK
ncbi:TPA: hypothetical protein N0F65_011648 [Lagenidium giganteum]|uniref:Uncharacterized protein n=1 Tax=Lagenidium giganteum TaxID=4803 RepID=A0AAV2ZCY0_9STRA|nr:TPA: hypothetical protein N0F65_011648 [Lagenidium giganteum]